MSQPWLSVLMPVLNGEKYIAEALESVALQSEGVECLVVDGGSTDRTMDVVAQFSSRLNISLIKFSGPANWVAQTNAALRAANGEFISILHQDDVWLAGRCDKLREAIGVARPDFLLHPVTVIGDSGRVLGRWNCPLPQYANEVDRELFLERLLVQNFIAIPAPAVRRTLALELGGMDEKLWYTADWDFYLKLAAVGSACYLGEALASFRIHADSLTVKGSKNREDFLTQMLSVLNRHIGALSDDGTRESVYKASELSANLNALLASAMHGNGGKILMQSIKLFMTSPTVLRRYYRDSRIAERAAARLRAGFQSRDP